MQNLLTPSSKEHIQFEGTKTGRWSSADALKSNLSRIDYIVGFENKDNIEDTGTVHLDISQKTREKLQVLIDEVLLGYSLDRFDPSPLETQATSIEAIEEQLREIEKKYPTDQYNTIDMLAYNRPYYRGDDQCFKYVTNYFVIKQNDVQNLNYV